MTKKFQILTILFLVFLIVSCNNFLKGNELQNQLEDVIAYKNAPFVPVSVGVEDVNYGTFSKTLFEDKKKGDTFELIFNLNSKKYNFIGWEVVSKWNNSVVKDESLLIEEKSREDNVITISVKILKEENDILLRPVCELVPDYEYVDISFSTDINTGKVTPEGKSSYYIGETISLKYEPSSGCNFIRWIVVDQNDKEIEDSVVTFKDNDKTKPETVITVVKGIAKDFEKGIKIKPVIYTGSPNYSIDGVYCDSQIKITFNVPLKNPEIESKISEYVKIVNQLDKDGQINYSNTYYDTPVLSDDGKTLTIKPKTDKIVELFKTKFDSDIYIVFSNEIKTAEGKNLSDSNGSIPVFNTRLNITRENNAPVFENLSVKSGSNSGVDKILSFENIDKWGEDAWQSNHVNSLKIDCTGFDLESGLNRLEITEYLVNNGKNIKSGQSSFNFDNSNSISIDYGFKTEEDGIIYIEFQLFDNIGNSSYKRTLYCLKDTFFDISNVKIKNNTLEIKWDEEYTTKDLETVNDLASIFYITGIDEDCSYNIEGFDSSKFQNTVEFWMGSELDNLERIQVKRDNDFEDYNGKSFYWRVYRIDKEKLSDLTKNQNVFINLKLTDDAGNTKELCVGKFPKTAEIKAHDHSDSTYSLYCDKNDELIGEKFFYYDPEGYYNPGDVNPVLLCNDDRNFYLNTSQKIYVAAQYCIKTDNSEFWGLLSDEYKISSENVSGEGIEPPAAPDFIITASPDKRDTHAVTVYITNELEKDIAYTLDIYEPEGNKFDYVMFKSDKQTFEKGSLNYYKKRDWPNDFWNFDDSVNVYAYATIHVPSDKNMTFKVSAVQNGKQYYKTKTGEKDYSFEFIDLRDLIYDNIAPAITEETKVTLSDDCRTVKIENLMEVDSIISHNSGFSNTDIELLYDRENQTLIKVWFVPSERFSGKSILTEEEINKYCNPACCWVDTSENNTKIQSFEVPVNIESFKVDYINSKYIDVYVGMEDNANNKTIVKAGRFTYVLGAEPEGKIVLAKDGENGYEFCYKLGDSQSQNYVYMYYPVDNSSSWSVIINSNGTWSDISSISDSWIKVYHYNYYFSSKGTSIPVYYYFDKKSKYNQILYYGGIIENSPQKKQVQEVNDSIVGIVSDAPVLIQTYSSAFNYKTEEEWKQFAIVTDCKSVDEGTNLYGIDLSLIQNDFYYCTIAYFTDGTSTMTKVQQKKK